MNDLTLPPHSETFEKSILSSMLQDPVEFIPRAIEAGITSERFYIPANSILFSVLVEKMGKGEVVELIALTQELKDSDKLDLMGGLSRLSEIYTYAVSRSAHFDSHVQGMLDKHILRGVIKFGSEITELAYNNLSVKELIPRLELGALSIGQDAEDKASFNFELKSAYKEFCDDLEAPSSPGIPTGFSSIDNLINGLHPGEVTVIGARPAIGKTSFAISLCENLAIHNDVSTALFVVEGKRHYITTRLVASVSHISAKRIRDLQLSKGDKEKIGRTVTKTKDAPLYIDDRITNAIEMSAKVRRLKQKYGIKVLVIDYIQKLPAALPEERADLRLRIKNATDVLHQTCKTLGIALVVLAQLGRVKGRDPMIDPQIEDLKESGSLEEDGDVVILLGNIGEDPDDCNATRRKLVRIAKNRHGPCDDVVLNFNPPTTRFH